MRRSGLEGSDLAGRFRAGIAFVDVFLELSEAWFTRLRSGGVPLRRFGEESLNGLGRQPAPAGLQKSARKPFRIVAICFCSGSISRSRLASASELRRSSDRQVQFGAAFVRPLQAVEHRHHAVVVARGQRLELVVVAAGAAERQAEEHLRRRADHVVQLVEAVLLRVGRLVVPGAQAVISRWR